MEEDTENFIRSLMEEDPQLRISSLESSGNMKSPDSSSVRYIPISLPLFTSQLNLRSSISESPTSPRSLQKPFFDKGRVPALLSALVRRKHHLQQ